MDKRLLDDGLTIVSQCLGRTGDIWEAHVGAAAIAGYFFAEDNGLAEETASRIAAEAAEMVRRYGPGPRERTGRDVPADEAERTILDALAASIDELHWVGHNAIYSALSLRAIRELGGWGTAAEIEGIAALVRSFAKTIPGRSWIGYSAGEVKRMKPADEDGFPVIAEPKQLSAFVLGELSAVKTIYHAEAHHDLLGHLLTFSHAINALYDLGHATFFERGVPAVLVLAKALRVSRDLDPSKTIPLRSPADRLPLTPAARAERLPVEPEFWEADYARRDWDFGHLFKFPFSFYDHLGRLDAPMPDAVENFRYVVCKP